MATSALTLPVDIPWKKLCVSEDMMDRFLCDRETPPRWRSSLAVFSYEPPEEQQTYPDQKVSYLKVISTITGYQPDPNEVGIKGRRSASYWHDPAVIENYLDVVSQYYGCYGAILEVGIAPPGNVREIPFRDYPYFADFEPKKRELYELVTDTGEIMSRSLENVNVRKGATTTTGHEVVDKVGWSGKLSAEYKGVKGEVGVETSSAEKDMNQEQYTNFRTSDQARELRETFSHSTQLTQMYHQFTSYHLGTNRSVFFMLPRPHIIQTDATFVNGPRLLEGIQEVFLVVVRPRSMGEPCVEAYLETAHIAKVPVYDFERSTGTLTLHVEKQAVEVDLDGADDSQDQPAEHSETYTPPGGWEVDVDRNGGYKIESISGERITEAKITEVALDHVTAFGKVTARYQDDTWPDANEFFNAKLDMVVTVYIRKKAAVVKEYRDNLWLTARGVCCCERRGIYEKFPDSVVFEAPKHFWTAPPRRQAETSMTIVEANRMRNEIGHEMIRSLKHPDRYKYGTRSFVDTRFVGETVARLVRRSGHPDNHPASEIRGLDEKLRARLAEVAPRLSRGRLLEMPLEEIADRYGFSEAEVVEIRRAALGLAGPEPTGADKWQRPGRRVRVPDVLTLPLDEAVKRLRDAGLQTEPRIVHLPPQPGRDHVVDVSPKSGTVVPPDGTVTLRVSGGEAGSGNGQPR